MQTEDITNHSSSAQRQTMGEIVRFGIVGLIATAVQYGVYWLLVGVLWPSVAMTVAYGVSFAFNFYASTHFTFRVSASTRRGLGFALSHAVNYALQITVLNVAIWAGFSPQLAPIPMFAVCVPVNFVLVRYFLKR